MDITETLAPKSEQLDAVELVEPRTFVVERVSKGNVEQPINVHMVGFPRPWRPGKSMRRVLAACWGVNASTWSGRSVRLYCDPTVRFGGEAVGGIRVSHLSHIESPKQVPLLVSRGKSAIFTVEPLTDDPSAPTADQIAACADVSELGAMWKSAPALRPLIEARVAELKATPAVDDDQPLIGGTE